MQRNFSGRVNRFWYSRIYKSGFSNKKEQSDINSALFTKLFGFGGAFRNTNRN